jgi:hypothetical protein
MSRRTPLVAVLVLLCVSAAGLGAQSVAARAGAQVF